MAGRRRLSMTRRSRAQHARRRLPIRTGIRRRAKRRRIRAPDRGLSLSEWELSASRPEAEIQPGLDFLDVEIGIRCVSRLQWRREVQRLRAETEIVVFDLGRPVLAETVLEAGAGGPAGAHEGRDGGIRAEIGQAALVLGEGDAALAVDEQPIERGAD